MHYQPQQETNKLNNPNYTLNKQQDVQKKLLSETKKFPTQEYQQEQQKNNYPSVQLNYQ
jgi:hypothetical protein